MFRTLAVSFLVGVSWAEPTQYASGLENMNGEYLISNPKVGAKPFSTQYSSYENVEYFDAYSPPITSKYGEVYWTMMDEVPLDKTLVDRFNGKVMAIVGFEADQVMKTPEGDKSVPITWAYNHHFEAYLKGSLSEMRQATAEEAHKVGHTYGQKVWHTFKRQDIVDPTPDSGIPTSQWFSEGNGGEYRKSYHGYPKGKAQLIESPVSFQIQPMQIDTKNRFYNGSDFRPGALPASSAAPPNASYSGLLECPCSTRIPKNISVSYSTTSEGSCSTEIHNSKECFEAATKVEVENVVKTLEVNDSKMPSGCYFITSDNNTSIVYYNTIEDDDQSTVKCGGGDMTSGTLKSDAALVTVTIKLDASTSIATIILEGPSSNWFSVGINAPSFAMSDLPYTIVVDGNGNVSERKLGNHAPGTLIKQSVTVTSNSIADGVRTVTMHRNFAGITSDHYTFSSSISNLPLIFASGTSGTYAYHGAKLRSGGTVHFASIDSPTCICYEGVKGTINGIPFHKDCLPEPKSDLLAEKNPTCFVDTYQGGLACCHHEVVLLDKEQVQPSEEMTYHMKFRFWFQEYDEKVHDNLIRIYWQTEAMATEYDILKCEDSTARDDCIFTIKSNFTVRDMMNDCDTRNNSACWGDTSKFDGINLVYAGGHCHAPSCLLMELYNADTNQLLCRHDPVYGKSHEVFDELGYLAIPPCLYDSEDEGLMPPTFLSYDTNLFSIKQNNNTAAHYGEMASWQMRGILAKKNEEK